MPWFLIGIIIAALTFKPESVDTPEPEPARAPDPKPEPKTERIIERHYFERAPRRKRKKVSEPQSAVAAVDTPEPESQNEPEPEPISPES